MFDVAGDEGLRLHRRPQFGGVDGGAVMTHSSRLLGEPRRKRGIAGSHDRPAVDEDLRADLLGERPAVDSHGAARRRLNPTFQIEPGRVLGRIAGPAPPQHGAVLDHVIQPPLADLAGRYVGVRPMILESADKGECTGDVVVGHHKGTIEAIMNVILNWPQLADDAPIAPIFKRSAEIDADQLTEHGRVSALQIVGRKDSHAPV